VTTFAARLWEGKGGADPGLPGVLCDAEDLVVAEAVCELALKGFAKPVPVAAIKRLPVPAGVVPQVERSGYSASTPGEPIKVANSRSSVSRSRRLTSRPMFIWINVNCSRSRS